jgi:hypothetical protein
MEVDQGSDQGALNAEQILTKVKELFGVEIAKSFAG